MMAFDFPSNPTVDQEYTPAGSPAGQIYVWKPPCWIVKDSGASGGLGTQVDWENINNKPATFPPTLPITEPDVINLVADLAAKAPLASPPLTGVPTVPTAAPGTSTTQIASTAFVGAAVAADVATWAEITGKPATFPPTVPITQNDVTNLVNDLTLKAPLASPALTGTPTAPTAAPGISTTQIASTAFVGTAITNDITPWSTDLSAKEPTITAGTTAQYWRGDKTWQTLPPPGIYDAPQDGKQYTRQNGAWVELPTTPFIFDTNGDAILKFGANIMVRIKTTGLILTKDDIEVFSVSV
jgi:hypothetical protein